MKYLPDEWIVNKNNTDYIHQILAQMDVDLISKGDTTFEDLLGKLINIGETVIVDKIKDGTIAFGA